MADALMYHSLHCRGVSVDQTAGELSYESVDSVHNVPFVSYQPVAQFIGPKPLSESCDSFSLEIINAGLDCIIGIGLCHKRYPPGRMPGWNTNSIGYHADNGGIYHEAGRSRVKFTSVGQGEVMSCSLDFDDRTVTFRLNGDEVFTSQPLQIPPGGFYPIIAMKSPGEVVRLLETEPWTPDNATRSGTGGVVFHSLYCREVRVSQRTGLVRYRYVSPDNRVGQLVSECPLSLEFSKFSIEIASLGQKSCISVGVCHRCYPSKCQPGWLPNSIAYHANNGGIYHGNGNACAKAPRIRAGDTVSCELDFSNNTVTFRRNGVLIYHSSSVKMPPGGFHAAVGFHSPGEVVCLIEKGPWRSAVGESIPAVPKYHFRMCRAMSVHQSSGILSCNGRSDGTLISKCPLTPEHYTFSIEIINPGKKCCIGLGLSPQHCSTGQQSCLVMHFIGANPDDENMQGTTSITRLTVRKGDIVACKFNFADSTARFLFNGTIICHSKALTAPHGGLYACVHLHSEFASARLCETGPWRDEDILPSHRPKTAPDNLTMPMCCICVDKAVTRFLIPCGHTFCCDCIEEWTFDYKTCPACRVQYEDVKTLFF